MYRSYTGEKQDNPCAIIEEGFVSLSTTPFFGTMFLSASHE
jgi:hypothetical protein